MGLTVTSSDQLPSAGESSTFFGLLQRAFNEVLAVWGVPITINNGAPKQCLASPVQSELVLEGAGRVPESRVRAIEMLAEDFDLFNVVPNTTKCVIGGITMTIMEVDRDPQDPTVRFNAVGVI